MSAIIAELSQAAKKFEEESIFLDMPVYIR
jgi:hypothetical protein